MNRIIIISLILSVGIYSALAENDSIQNESVEGKTFIFKASDKPAFESKIHDHITIFNRLHKDSIQFIKKRSLNKQMESHEKIHVVFNPERKEWEYNDLAYTEYGNWY